MKNWENLEPDKYTLVGPHRFTKGRARPVDRIIIHHNAGVRLSSEQVRDLWDNSREASAHYQVEADGTIGQLVNDWDTAWHAANADINARSIGIEHANIGGPPRWQISDATIDAGAHLVAALCRAHKLGRPVWGQNVFPHSRYTSTSCPHQLDVGGEDHATYMARAQYWYDEMGKPAGVQEKREESMSEMTLGGVSAAALNEAKIKAQSAASVAADNQIQLRGPGCDGWSVSWLAEQYAKRSGDKGTVPELLAVALQALSRIEDRLDEIEKGK